MSVGLHFESYKSLNGFYRRAWRNPNVWYRSMCFCKRDVIQDNPAYGGKKEQTLIIRPAFCVTSDQSLTFCHIRHFSRFLQLKNIFEYINMEKADLGKHIFNPQ